MPHSRHLPSALFHRERGSIPAVTSLAMPMTVSYVKMRPQLSQPTNPPISHAYVALLFKCTRTSSYKPLLRFELLPLLYRCKLEKVERETRIELATNSLEECGSVENKEHLRP